MHPIKNSKLIKKSIHKSTIINNNNNNILKGAKKSSHNRNEETIYLEKYKFLGIINNEISKLLFL